MQKNIDIKKIKQNLRFLKFETWTYQIELIEEIETLLKKVLTK